MTGKNDTRISVTAVIQARMGSTRLPGKVMLDLAGRPLIAHVIERSAQIKGVDRVVLATSPEREDRSLLDLAESMNIHGFAGPRQNVLERFFLASQKYGGDYIIRVTGDNPFTDPGFAAETLQHAVTASADLCSPLGLPLGSAVEVISRNALEQAYNMSDRPYHREHVTPYIKEHPEQFRIHRYDAVLDNPPEDLRLTVDTREDYLLAKAICEHFASSHVPDLEEIISFLRENPALAAINRGIIQKPMTSAESE